MALDVCEDCKRRVRVVLYDTKRREHVVHMQSLT
jgi:hypothetical protein